MADTQLFETTLEASVRQSASALEAEITDRSARALGMSQDEFTQNSQRHNTANGYRRTWEQVAVIDGRELFVRITIDFDAKSETATVQCVETAPEGTASTTTTLRLASRGRTSVAVTGQAPEGMSAAYQRHLRIFFAGVESRTGEGLA